jgi:hypothetical protein
MTVETHKNTVKRRVLFFTKKLWVLVSPEKPEDWMMA